MFIDIAKIKLKAGKGGDGAVAWRREKFEPAGGPAGGDGGRGGNVIVMTDSGLHTLMDFRYKREYKAENGQYLLRLFQILICSCRCGTCWLP